MTAASRGGTSPDCATTRRGRSGSRAAGGLILHSLVPHPDDERQIWVAISAAGVFHTADGGETWEARNRGTRADFLPEGQNYPEYGQCVHCVVMAPGMPDRLYQQNHCGMYRSEDGGRRWDSIEAGLPSTFGFPAAVHPRDPATLYLLPLNGDIAGRYVPDGKAAVWRTRDGGDTGRRCGRACRRRTRSSACCARRWRPTGSNRPGSISARTPASCSPALTKATAGPASRNTCPRSPPWRRWSSRRRRLRRSYVMPNDDPPSLDLAEVIVTLPAALVSLFPGAARRLELRPRRSTS